MSARRWSTGAAAATSAAWCSPNFLVFFIGGRREGRRLPECRLEALGERARRVVTARFQQLVARGDLDEDRDIPSGSDGHAQQRHPQPEGVVEVVAQAGPL